MTTRRLVSFDWAIKKLLRSKANFSILEGFLSELLKDDIQILEILESESNQDDCRDKFNRVDLKVKNQHDCLQLSAEQQALYGKSQVNEIFPEYYLIKVNSFDDVAKDSLDEWIYFLKNEEIREDFQAKGLKAAQQTLDILKLPEEERLAYERYQDDLHYQASMFASYTIGLMKGEANGERKKSMAIATKLFNNGQLDIKTIVEMTGLSQEDIKNLDSAC